MSFDRFMVARDAASNPKVKRMKRAGKETRWAWFHGVLAIAARAQPRGYLVVGGLAADEHDVADIADVTVAEARRALEVGRDLGMLVRDEDTGTEFVHDWDEFNPAPRNDPTNAERQQRFRDRNAARNGSNAPNNAPVTGSNTPEVEEEVEVEVEVEEQQQQPARVDPSIAAFEIQCIFDAWLTATDRESSRTKFSDKRRKIIKAALKSHGYDDCLMAVENIGRSTEARNGYGRGTRFDDISHALGSAEQIEKWRDWKPPPAGARNGNGGPPKGSLDEAYARQERLKAQAQRMAALDDADAATAQIEETNQ